MGVGGGGGVTCMQAFPACPLVFHACAPNLDHASDWRPLLEQCLTCSVLETFNFVNTAAQPGCCVFIPPHGSCSLHQV